MYLLTVSYFMNELKTLQDKAIKTTQKEEEKRRKSKMLDITNYSKLSLSIVMV